MVSLGSGIASTAGIASASKYWKVDSPKSFIHVSELKSGKMAQSLAIVANQSSMTTWNCPVMAPVDGFKTRATLLAWRGDLPR